MDTGFEASQELLQRHQYGAGLLAALAEALDITKEQHARAESAYRSISDVIQRSEHQYLRTAKVFPQGSFAFGTVIRPVDEDEGEFDVDLICRLGTTTTALQPSQAKRLIHDVLASDGRYRDRLVEKCRCWRVEYQGEFHLDVAPVAVHGLADGIPDRDLSRWLPTAPEKFAHWFNALAEQSRTMQLREQVVAKADVSPFPEAQADKGWLRRVVQLLKRSRDEWVMKNPLYSDHAPISIIITTLAARAFENIIARGHSFPSMYALVEAIVSEMPSYIETRMVNGRIERWVVSPVADENFANRWNADPMWEQAFDSWHLAVRTFLTKLQVSNGLVEAQGVLEGSFGSKVTARAMTETANVMRVLREGGTGSVRYSKSAGGLTAAAASAGVAVRPHTFYGE
jgi:hypothetical protein